MEQLELTGLLDTLITAWESEVAEFKQAGKDFKTDVIGKYFSALANEANLQGLEKAWLVFGIDNGTHSVTGTDYRSDSERLHSTKNANCRKHRTQYYFS